MANEKRLDLIDRKALEEHIGDCYGYPAVDILHEIAIFPGVDAIEVVRCKDCVHMEHTPDGLRWCNVWGGINGMGDEGFCNYGERNDGDQT